MVTMDRIAKSIFPICALAFGILGALAVLILAAGRHLSIGEYSKELLLIVGKLQTTHSLLGILAILNINKLGTNGKIGAGLCLIGSLLFCVPIVLLAFKVILGAPTSPFGGICFAASWLFIGIGAFRYSFGLGKNNDKA